MDIKLPQLAEGVESGTVVSILVSEGQEIKKDQPFMELETQKAVGSIPAPQSGRVSKIHVKEGMEVLVGQVLISIDGEKSATTPVAPSPTDYRGAPIRPAPLRDETPASNPPESIARDSRQVAEAYDYQSKSGAPPPASPSIRKIARDLGIDLGRIKGSQSGGRIEMADLRAYVQRLQHDAFQAQPAPPVAVTAPAPQGQKGSIDYSRWGAIRREKVSALKRTVSQRMTQSWTTIPKIDQLDEADITGLLALRKKYAPAYEKKQTHLTLTPFIMQAVCKALQKHPRANASVDEATHEIVFKDYYHIGVAVDTEAGLIVPVLRDANRKSLLELAREINQLTEKTRQRKVSMDELQGGTFTISNQGSIGGSYFTPIIYPPQVAILGTGQASPKPVVFKGKVTIRTLLPLCLAYDHRALDGADAVRFLRAIVDGLESFPEGDVKIK